MIFNIDTYVSQRKMYHDINIILDGGQIVW